MPLFITGEFQDLSSGCVTFDGGEETQNGSEMVEIPMEGGPRITIFVITPGGMLICFYPRGGAWKEAHVLLPSHILSGKPVVCKTWKVLTNWPNFGLTIENKYPSNDIQTNKKTGTNWTLN